MTINTFKKIIELLKSHDEKTQKLYELGIDLTEYGNDLHNVISHLIGACYGKSGKDWIDWWCFEKEWGTRTDMTATDSDGTQICDTIENLWKYVEENKTDDYEVQLPLTAEQRIEMLKNIFEK